MARKFMDENFLLRTETARRLYHEHAYLMPIYDYHSHLSPAEIAEDKNFDNITQAWLYGDHYKWRALRTNGVPEKYCTGDASDEEKFAKWAETVPYTLRNPLYHWTHLELRRYFSIENLLNPDTAPKIYQSASEMLRSPEFSVRNLLRKMNVKLVCTTDDPLDTLEHHRKIADDDFEIEVYPTWRPDKAHNAENIDALNHWIDNLAATTDIHIKDYPSYLDALYHRHTFFHDHGCRLSDHGLDAACAADYTDNQIKTIFNKIRSRGNLDSSEKMRFKSALLVELALMDHDRGWVQQFHLGPLRNCNTRMIRSLGPDTGFDSIGDFEQARPLARFLDRLDLRDQLPPTIIYNLNPRDNELFAAMIGNFQDGSSPGKIQFGSAWWFLDQKDGMTRQLNALSNLSLLSRFVGMLTDSRSFLSFPRHEYFRRILCDLIGRDVENGELPADLSLLGTMVRNISFHNAHNYFPMRLDLT